jgi:MFS transporter, DHA2 family, multidrug resistance protein
MPANTTNEDLRFEKRYVFIVIILTIASFMEALDTSIANVSLPNITGNLSAAPEEGGWVISSYLIANAIVIPISGWLSTYFGRKNFYMVCVVIFVAASLLCGLAWSIESLVFFRVLQGLGGGSLVPLEQSFIADIVPPEKRGMAFSIYGFALITAPIAGPTIGGWITDNYSWHWIFFINIPIGILSLFLTWRFVREPQSTIEEREKLKRENFKIDWVGLILFVVGIGALTIVLEKGNREDWFESEFIVFFGAIALVALLVGVAWEMYQKNPAVDVRLLANRSVASGSIMMFFVAFIVYGSLVYVPQMAQAVFGYDATTAGLIMSPGGFITLILMPTVGFLTKKIEARILIIVGLLFSAGALWHLTSLSLHIGFEELMWARIYQSFATAFLFVPITTAAFRGIPRGKTDNASALISLAVNLGGSFGIALLATFLSRRTQSHTSALSINASEYNPNYVQWLERMTQTLMQQGMQFMEAASQARAMIWSEIRQQAAMLAYLDLFFLLMLLVLALIPMVFLFKSSSDE